MIHPFHHSLSTPIILSKQEEGKLPIEAHAEGKERERKKKPLLLLPCKKTSNKSSTQQQAHVENYPNPLIIDLSGGLFTRPLRRIYLFSSLPSMPLILPLPTAEALIGERFLSQ